MKYFLTGATGFIGGEIAVQLRAAGHEVVALVRDESKATALTALGVTVVQGDITDKESMRAPMTGVDGVFHVAAWYKLGVKHYGMAEHINVQGTRNVLELMRELNIPRGVYTSTLVVFSDTKGQLVDETYRYDGPHLSEYDRTKWLAHYEVALPMMAEGLPLIIVQPGLTYGPGDTSAIHDVLTQYLQKKLPAAPQKTGYCWAHVEDAARGHLLAMEHGTPGETYIISGPAHTLIDALATAERITGIAAPRLHPAPGMMKAMSAVAGLVEKVVPLPETYTAETLRVSAGVTYWGSNQKARRELGFEPRPLEEGLRETLLHEMRLLGMSAK